MHNGLSFRNICDYAHEIELVNNVSRLIWLFVSIRTEKAVRYSPIPGIVKLV